MSENVLQAALFRLLRPLVRVLLRQGMTFDEFSEVGKRVYIDVAEQDFRLEGRKQTISRISMLTGVQRKEVSRLQKLKLEPDTDLDSNYNRGVRVTSGWRRDREFSHANGDPKALPMDGEGSFSELVRRYSGDLPARAVLDEFRRVGVVDVNNEGDVVLRNPAGYVPSSSERDQLNILGQATGDLLATFAHNLEPDNDDKHLQLTVAYNNLPLNAAREFKVLSQADGFKLLRQFDEWLSTRDRDANPEVSDEGGRYRAGVGIYYFEEPVVENNDPEST